MMRFDVGPKPADPTPIPTLGVTTDLEQNAALPPALLQVLPASLLLQPASSSVFVDTCHPPQGNIRQTQCAYSNPSARQIAARL